MPALRRFNASLDRCVSAAAVACFAAIFAVVLVQIVFRYVLKAPLVWTEEAARYLYIWTCYLGGAMAYRRGQHIVIEVLLKRVFLRAATAARVAGQLLAGAFFLTLTVQGARLVMRTGSVLAITLPLAWSVIYAAAPLTAAVMFFQTLEMLGDALIGSRRRER
ncbi:MAG: TRAP transporter small permease [Armatimonadota bacterium]|nr:TRAP transporter small permease [Armatimonadota bacterium]MDR7484942.1 TRAP transporter small permease [Armatimonadota bacterium]MDR7533645.1 TRAP transporter small permease [Armatimonadota bacterium]MDR7535456.1 TRAP transporter small permease [Armatimonadota bacterium]